MKFIVTLFHNPFLHQYNRELDTLISTLIDLLYDISSNIVSFSAASSSLMCGTTLSMFTKFRLGLTCSISDSIDTSVGADEGLLFGPGELALRGVGGRTGGVDGLRI
jgi:hypothetical protein